MCKRGPKMGGQETNYKQEKKKISDDDNCFTEN